MLEKASSHSWLLILALLAVAAGCTPSTSHVGRAQAYSSVPRETLPQLAAPKAGRARPLVVVLADNAATETTDFVIPYGVLKESGVADVLSVSTGPGAVTLVPALRIRADMPMAEFDAAHPAGADILIVPAMQRNDDPALLRWVRAQSDKGALVVAICEGAWVVANAGLLEGRSATSHWLALGRLAKALPATRWVRDHRWVVDGPVMTTTGVSASLPASLALVEAIAGRPAAQRTADRLGLASWTSEHDSAAFALTAGHVALAATHWLARWRHETIEIPVDAGFDETSTALQADAWSRTFRSQARATHAGGAARSRRGLVVETHTASAGSLTLPAAPATQAGIALDTTLQDIAARYGESTADLVALGLEHRRGNRDRDRRE